jgi:hypothetical protein
MYETSTWPLSVSPPRSALVAMKKYSDCTASFDRPDSHAAGFDV